LEGRSYEDLLYGWIYNYGIDNVFDIVELVI